jgi:uncharacterized membrane protein
MALMLISATAAIFIQQVNPGRFSWLHIFVVVTYVSIARSIFALRRKDIRGHKASMLGLYVGGLLIAGGLTFLPGRIMYRLFFD